MGLRRVIQRLMLPSPEKLERRRQKVVAHQAKQSEKVHYKVERHQEKQARKVARYFHDRIRETINARSKAGEPLYSGGIKITRVVHEPTRWGWETDAALARQVGGPERLSELMRDFGFQKLVEDMLRDLLAFPRKHPLEIVEFERFDGGPGRGRSDWTVTVGPPEVPEEPVPLASAPVAV